MDPDEAASLERVRQALVDYINAFGGAEDGDLVTDFVVVAGWVNVKDETDGVHIAASNSPGYTLRGLLAQATDIQSNSMSTGDDD